MELTLVFHLKNLHLLVGTLTLGKKPYLTLAPFLWNNLQNTLKSATSINAFKHSIKNHYFNELKNKES